MTIRLGIIDAGTTGERTLRAAVDRVSAHPNERARTFVLTILPNVHA